MPRKRTKLRHSPYENKIISLVMVVKDNWSLIHQALEKLTLVLEIFPHYEIVLIDNSSKTRTLSHVSQVYQTYPQTRVLMLSKEMPTEVALTAGLENTLGDYVVLFNPDTDKAPLIPRIIAELDQGYDLVLARFNVEDYILHSPIDRLFIKQLKQWYKRDVFSYVNYFSGFNRQVVNSLSKIKRKRKNFSYLNSFIGFKRKTLAYVPRKATRSNLGEASLISVLLKIAGASLANSEKPLRLAWLIALAASFLNFLFLIYVLIVSLVKHNLAEGWLTTSVMIGTMFLLLFVVLAILAEYILRIWDESHQEPVYFISQEVAPGTAKTERRLNIV